MIGRIERICDGARYDARRGFRKKSTTMPAGDWGYYSNAWKRERARMASRHQLPQLDVFLDCPSSAPPV